MSAQAHGDPATEALGGVVLTGEVLMSDAPREPVIAPSSAELESTVNIKPSPWVRPEPNQVMMTSVGLRIPANLTFEDWERAGCRLSGIVNSSLWCLGDWLVYGK